MSSSLASLTTQLQAEIPALNDTPAADSYRQAVIDAIADLSDRQPCTAVATLPIVAEVASYDLPADFVRLIRLADLPIAGGVLITSDGLVPMGWSSGCAETLTISGLTLTITPTPAYSTTRTLHYSAGDVLADDDDTYATLDARRASLALLKARATVLQLQAAVAARDAWVSEVGPEKVDKTKQAAELRAAAAVWQAQYDAATSQAAVPYGSRS